MSWDVDVRAPEGSGLPDPLEPIIAMCQSMASLACLFKSLGLPNDLPHVKCKAEAMIGLNAVIAELHKGDTGVFSDAWCVEADRRWSEGREVGGEYSKWLEVLKCRPKTEWPAFCQSYEGYVGYSMRDRLLRDATRFLVYYHAGYDVTFTW